MLIYVLLARLSHLFDKLLCVLAGNLLLLMLVVYLNLVLDVIFLYVGFHRCFEGGHVLEEDVVFGVLGISSRISKIVIGYTRYK